MGPTRFARYLAVGVLLSACAPLWPGGPGVQRAFGPRLVADVEGQCVAGCRTDENGIWVCDLPCDAPPPAEEPANAGPASATNRHVSDKAVVVAAVLLGGVALFFVIDLGYGIVTGHPPVTF